MQIGMIGLGRMGANMVQRLMNDGHQCVVFDINAGAVANLAAQGAASRERAIVAVAGPVVGGGRRLGGGGAGEAHCDGRREQRARGAPLPHRRSALAPSGSAGHTGRWRGTSARKSPRLDQ